MTVPFGGGLPTVPLLVGLDGGLTTQLVRAGQPVVAPVLVSNAVIDTGASDSSADPSVIRRLGLTPCGFASNQTAGGIYDVDLFRVSVGFPAVFGWDATSVVVDPMEISEFAHPIPGVEFLLGMDFLSRCRLFLDGPDRTLAIDF